MASGSAVMASGPVVMASKPLTGFSKLFNVSPMPSAPVATLASAPARSSFIYSDASAPRFISPVPSGPLLYTRRAACP